MRIPDAYFSGGLGRSVAQPLRGSVDFDTGAAETGRAVQRLAQTVGAIAGDHIATEGRAELNAALERQAETKRLERIKAESAARSSLFRHESDMSDLARSVATDTGLTHKERRDKFVEEARKLRAGFESSVPEEYRYSFAPAFDEHRAKAEGLLDTYLQKELTDEIRANGVSAREALVNSARPLADKLQMLKDPDSWDWQGEGYSDTERQAIVSRLSEEATGAEIERRFDAEDPRTVLADLRATTGEGGEYAHYGDLSPKVRQAYIRTSRSLIDQQERDAERARKEAKLERERMAGQAFANYKEMREGLFPVDPKQEAGFWRLVAGTEYEDKAKEVRKTTGALGFVAEKVKEDPLKYGAAQLGLDVPQLSMDAPGEWQDQLAARSQVAAVIQQTNGLSYLPILTNDEAKGLAGLFQAQTPQSQVQTVTGLAKGLGKDSVQQMARQFAAQDHDLGMLVGLAAAGKEKAAYHVADGRRLLAEKAAPMPTALQQDLRTRFNDTMETALSGFPQMREGFFRATTAAYLSLTAGAGVHDPERFDADAFDQAVEMVVGKPVSINGKAVLPPEGMNEEQFLDNLNQIGAEQLQAAGGVHGFASAAEAAEAIRDDAEPWEAGAGRYRFAIDGRFLMTKDGSRPLELDLTTVSKPRKSAQKDFPAGKALPAVNPGAQRGAEGEPDEQASSPPSPAGYGRQAAAQPAAPAPKKKHQLLTHEPAIVRGISGAYDWLTDTDAEAQRNRQRGEK